MKQPNNLRNRYRRKCEAVTAYGWSRPSLEEWINYTAGLGPMQYATAGGPDAEVRIGGNRFPKTQHRKRTQACRT